MRRVPALLMGLLLMACTFVQAKGFDPEKDVTVAFRKGAVVLTLPPGAHLKAAFMEIALQKGVPGTLKVGPLPPTKDKDELGDGVWHDRVVIPVTGTGLKGEVPLVVTYQPCTEGEGGVCYAPTDRILKVKASELQAPAPEAMVPVATAPETKAALAPPTPVAAAPAAPRAPEPLSWRRMLLVFLTVFAFGMIASLTPCVYPMIPITMAIIGAKSQDGGKMRGFTLSLTLVLGMAVTYTTLGVVAGLTGAAFGSIAQSPAFLVPVSVLFGLFALSLFGAFELRLPDALQQKLQGGGARKGYAGAFVMGLVLGPLSAPCVGPIILSILVAIGQQGQVLLGAAQLFTFALGMGVLFIVVGTFTAALPRSGDWLEKLKHIMGLLVLGFAVWNLRLLVPDWANYAMWSVTMLMAAPVLGAFQPAEGLVAGFLKTLGLLGLALGLLLGIRAVEARQNLELLPRGGAAAPAAKALVDWTAQDLEGAQAKAEAGHKLVLIDTYAEWCAECKELDEKTWTDPQVAAWIKDQAVPVRIDTDKVRQDLRVKLGIHGYPTVLVLDAQGHELRRSSGFLKPERMLVFLKGQ